MDQTVHFIFLVAALAISLVASQLADLSNQEGIGPSFLPEAAADGVASGAVYLPVDINGIICPIGA